MGSDLSKCLMSSISLSPSKARKLDAISEFERKQRGCDSAPMSTGEVDKCAICRIRFAGTLVSLADHKANPPGFPVRPAASGYNDFSERAASGDLPALVVMHSTAAQMGKHTTLNHLA